VSALICIYKPTLSVMQQIGCGIKVLLGRTPQERILRVSCCYWPANVIVYARSLSVFCLASVSVCKYPDNLAGNRIAMMNYFDRLSKWWAPPRRVLAGRGAYGNRPRLSQPRTARGRISRDGTTPSLFRRACCAPLYRVPTPLWRSESDPRGPRRSTCAPSAAWRRKGGVCLNP
jgi:hypothetical protein